jgi:hypothetical protein
VVGGSPTHIHQYISLSGMGQSLFGTAIIPIDMGTGVPVVGVGSRDWVRLSMHLWKRENVQGTSAIIYVNTLTFPSVDIHSPVISVMCLAVTKYMAVDAGRGGGGVSTFSGREGFPRVGTRGR